MKPIGIETFKQFFYPSGPMISPDESTVAFVVQTVNEKKDGYDGDLYTLELASGELRQLTAQGDAKAFTWTKEGKLLFAAPRGKEFEAAKAQGLPLTAYYEIDPQTGGEAAQVAALPVGAGLPSFLSDGRWVVLDRVDLNRPRIEAMEGPEKEKAIREYKNPRYHVFEEIPFYGDGQGYTSRLRNTLRLIDPATGEGKALTEPFFHVSKWDCAHDKIVYTGSKFSHMPAYYEGVYLCDPYSGKIRTLVEEDRFRAGKPVFLDENTIIITLCPKEDHTFGFGDFYRIDLVSGEMSLIAKYESYVGMPSRVNSDARLGAGQLIKAVEGKVWFASTEEDGHYLHTIDRDGKLSERLSQPGSTDSFDVGGNFVVLCGMRENKLSELYLLKDGKETQLTHLNDFVQKEYAISTPEEVRYTGSDGFEIVGWVMKPTGCEKGKKYPGIFHIHGGPKTALGSIFHHEMQMWASAGYFVLYCNFRGSDGRGVAFADLKGIFGTVDYVNQMEFVDECLRLYPELDGERLGVTGGSYGGSATNWIIGQTGRFKAACAQRSVSNWLGFEGISDGGFFSNRVQHGAEIAEDAETLWNCSPLKHAHKATTPTLFIHSDEDYRCCTPEALQMFVQLKLAGVPSRVALFHGECHELSRSGRPRNRVSRMQEILSWFDHYLKG